jgi:hypothetical protein
MSLGAAWSCGVGGEIRGARGKPRGRRAMVRAGDTSLRERVRAATKYSVRFAAFAAADASGFVRVRSQCR